MLGPLRVTHAYGFYDALLVHNMILTLLCTVVFMTFDFLSNISLTKCPGRK